MRFARSADDNAAVIRPAQGKGKTMGARQLVAIGFRLFAIWLCVSALQLFAIASAIRKMTAAWGDAWWVGILVVGVCVGIALIVWGLSGAMARGLMAGLERTPQSTFSPLEMVVVGCILMGLWWLKESFVPLVGLWMRAVALSSGESAFAWLGTAGKLNAAMNLIQIGIGLFFVCRPYQIAQWVLRHAPIIHNATDEPFDSLILRARDLGRRQVARPDIIAKLVDLISSHPASFSRLAELMELLRYEPNPYARMAAARAIFLLGHEAAVRAMPAAVDQLAKEDSPEVIEDLNSLIASAGQHQSIDLHDPNNSSAADAYS